MSSDSRGEQGVREALRLVRAAEVDHDLDSPADEGLVAAAEQRLGIRFPPSYRTFLREAGCGAVEGEEFYGLTPGGLDGHGVPNAVWLYEDGRRRGQPARFFVFYDYGDGTAVALDVDRIGAGGEVPCVAAHAGDWEHAEEVASDFGAFFLATVTEAVNSEGSHS